MAGPTHWSRFHREGAGAKHHDPFADRGDVDNRHSLPALAAHPHYASGHLESRAVVHCPDEVALDFQSGGTHFLPDAFIGDHDFPLVS